MCIHKYQLAANFVSQVLCRLYHSTLGFDSGKLNACKGEAKWRVLTAPHYLVDKAGLQWKSFKASTDMLVATLVPLHQVGLVTHFWNDINE